MTWAVAFALAMSATGLLMLTAVTSYVLVVLLRA